MPAPTLPGQGLPGGRGHFQPEKSGPSPPSCSKLTWDSLPLSKLHALEAVDLGSFRRARFARTIWWHNLYSASFKQSVCKTDDGAKGKARPASPRPQPPGKGVAWHSEASWALACPTSQGQGLGWEKPQEVRCQVVSPSMKRLVPRAL